MVRNRYVTAVMSDDVIGYAASQWLSTWLQMLGVAMVTGVAFTAVLEHHLNSVNPGMRTTRQCAMKSGFILTNQVWWDWPSPMHCQ